jgi:hypothetical protein
MPRTAAAEELHAELDYQVAVNRVLLATTRPARSLPAPADHDRAEMDEMDLAYAMGLSAAGFAARLIARDKAGAQ